MASFREFLGKLININNSRWSRYFLICATVQAICVCTIQYVILTTNDDDTSSIKDLNGSIMSQGINSTPFKDNPMGSIAERGDRLITENAFILALDIFILILCFDVVWNSDHIELLTVIFINFLMTAYAAIEIIESYMWVTRIINTAQAFGVNANVDFKSEQYSIAHATILGFFAILFAFFGYKLYREFEWDGYHRAGASSEMQALYRIKSIFNLLIKLDFFFAWGFGIYYVYESYLYWNKLPSNPVATTVYLTVLIVLFPLATAIGYTAIQRKNTWIMLIFLAYWFSVPGVYILGLLQTPIQPWGDLANKAHDWYFFIFQLFTCGFLTTLTFVYGILVCRAFDKGLERFFAPVSRSLSPTQRHSAKRHDSLRFSIDDDDDDDDDSGDENDEITRQKRRNHREKQNQLRNLEIGDLEKGIQSDKLEQNEKDTHLKNDKDEQKTTAVTVTHRKRDSSDTVVNETERKG